MVAEFVHSIVRLGLMRAEKRKEGVGVLSSLAECFESIMAACVQPHAVPELHDSFSQTLASRGKHLLPIQPRGLPEYRCCWCLQSIALAHLVLLHSPIYEVLPIG